MELEQARISIHALRVEGDKRGKREIIKTGISIHALRVEGDLAEFKGSLAEFEFLSTPSA